MTPERLAAQADQLHQAGQKAGSMTRPSPSSAGIPGRRFRRSGHVYGEILLKDGKGRFLPRVDGAIPYDVTHPLWKEMTRYKFDRFAA